jgi:hypothetical protein
MLCWKGGNMTDCPAGVDLVWHWRPATSYMDGEPFSGIYELAPGNLNNTRTGPNKKTIDHANLHGCRKSIGFW